MVNKDGCKSKNNLPSDKMYFKRAENRFFRPGGRPARKQASETPYPTDGHADSEILTPERARKDTLPPPFPTEKAPFRKPGGLDYHRPEAGTITPVRPHSVSTAPGLLRPVAPAAPVRMFIRISIRKQPQFPHIHATHGGPFRPKAVFRRKDVSGIPAGQRHPDACLPYRGDRKTTDRPAASPPPADKPPGLPPACGARGRRNPDVKRKEIKKLSYICSQIDELLRNESERIRTERTRNHPAQQPE